MHYCHENVIACHIRHGTSTKFLSEQWICFQPKYWQSRREDYFLVFSQHLFAGSKCPTYPVNVDSRFTMYGSDAHGRRMFFQTRQRYKPWSYAQTCSVHVARVGVTFEWHACSGQWFVFKTELRTFDVLLRIFVFFNGKKYTCLVPGWPSRCFGHNDNTFSDTKVSIV